MPMDHIELSPLIASCESFLRAFDDWEAVRILKGTSKADAMSLAGSVYWQLMQLESSAAETFRDVTGLRSDNAELLDAATRIRRAVPILAAKLRKDGKPINLSVAEPFRFPPAPIELMRRAVESAKRNASAIPIANPTVDNLPLHPRQQAILDALKCRALQTKALVKAAGVSDQKQFFRDYLSPLKEKGLVMNKRGIGYFRPDAPPPTRQ